MLALAWLTSIALAARNPPPKESHHPRDPVIPTNVCPLSVPEARHLLARLLFPPPSSPPLILAWSMWRRKHQHVARICHTRHRWHRLAKELPGVSKNSPGALPGNIRGLPRYSWDNPRKTCFSCWLPCFMKGASIMTLVPLNECCLRLGIDPKTLRLWRNRRSTLLLSTSHRCSSQMSHPCPAPAISRTAWSLPALMFA